VPLANRKRGGSCPAASATSMRRGLASHGYQRAVQMLERRWETHDLAGRERTVVNILWLPRSWVDTIKIELRGMGRETPSWMQLDHDHVIWRGLVLTVLMI
jgi:hypothetical protein